MARSRSNPLALAVLVCLLKRPMHPYEVATTLRQRAKERSVKLNYGALYGVVDSLRNRGLIEPKETERAGRLPERTIYELTEAGRIEVNDWLADLISSPNPEYPQFVAALGFLPALPPGYALDLLKERLQHLALEDAQAMATLELMQKHGLPRLLWVDEGYRERMRATEIEFVRSCWPRPSAPPDQVDERWRSFATPDASDLPEKLTDSLGHGSPSIFSYRDRRR